MSEKLKEIIENMPKDALINSFETVYEDSIKKDLEIERLNNIIKETIDFVESMEYCGQEDYFYDNKSKDACGNDNTFNDSKNKLLNILKENK